MGQIVSFEGYKPPDRFDATAWTQVQIEEAPASTGAWTVIDTLTLDPVDTDPSHPATRSFTTVNGTGPGLWYRVVFLDATGGRSSPTMPVRNSDAGPPARFATADDLAVRLGLELSDDEAERAERLLEAASGLIQDEAKQTIALVEDDELTMSGTSDEVIKLPQRPVVSVASVTLDSVALAEGSDWYLDGNAIVRIPSSSVLVLEGGEESAPGGGRGFGWPTQTLTIVYTHGYETIPESVKAIAVEAAVRVWVNPGSVIQERAGETSTLYNQTPTGLMLTSDERRAIRRFFGRSARSVTIGR